MNPSDKTLPLVTAVTVISKFHDNDAYVHPPDGPDGKSGRFLHIHNPSTLRSDLSGDPSSLDAGRGLPKIWIWNRYLKCHELSGYQI